MNNNICIIAPSLWNIEENFMLRDIACLCPFCSTHLCFMVISCFTCINYLNMCSIIKKAKRTFALDIMLQTNLLDYLKSFFFSTTWRLAFPAVHKVNCLRNFTKVLPQKLHKDFHFNNWSLLPHGKLYGSFILSQLNIIRALHQFCLSYHELDHCTFP